MSSWFYPSDFVEFFSQHHSVCQLTINSWIQIQVDMINAVTANFLGDNLQCWMQIQVGKGPWSSEVSGIVKIGQTMTMVMGIKVTYIDQHIEV